MWFNGHVFNNRLFQLVIHLPGIHYNYTCSTLVIVNTNFCFELSEQGTCYEIDKELFQHKFSAETLILHLYSFVFRDCLSSSVGEELMSQ